MKNKNIFLLSTDKGSNLFIDIDNNKLTFTNNPIAGEHFMNQFIYITNDEEIKEGNWCIDENNIVYKQIFPEFTNPKKVILTNDPTLIADGVQEIDSSFLSFFAENPVDYVEVIESYNQELNACKEVCEFKQCHSFFECKYVDENDLSKTYTLIIPQKYLEQKMYEQADLKVVINNPKNFKERAKNYMRLKDGYKEKLHTKQDLEKAFNQGSASHELFKQTHLNFEEWYDKNYGKRSLEKRR